MPRRPLDSLIFQDELELLGGAEPEAPDPFTTAVNMYKQMGFPEEAVSRYSTG